MKSEYIKYLLIAGLATFLFGCASGAKIENMVYTGLESQQKVYDDALKEEVAVQAVTGGQQTNSAWTSNIGNEEYLGAIKRSLAEQGLLTEAGRYQFTIKLLLVEPPRVFGFFPLAVTTHVRYILKDTKSDRVILNKTIVARYVASLSESLVYNTRLRLANEGSARKNIKGLFEELSKLKINPK